MIEIADVIRFLERDGPFLAVLAAVVVSGLWALGGVYRSYEERGRERIGLYVVSSLQMWIFFLAFLSYVYWARVVVAGEPVEATLNEFGLISPINSNEFIFWSASLIVLWIGIAGVSSVLQKALGLATTQARDALQPQTREEIALWSILMAPTAGICEEVFFRGYVISFLMRTQEEWIAIAIPSVAFGLLHYAQGIVGMLASGVMAATAGWVFVATGSLWPPIVAHIVYNIGAPFLFVPDQDQTKA